MTDLPTLAPREVWKHFFSLTRIPRPSGHEEEVRAFVAGFGRDLGLETMVDSVGNVLIRKPATNGMSDRPGVILQAHLDMVPQKTIESDHDFTRDPIVPRIAGDWLMASGTTLGADNGIGVAAAMAVLESATLAHGPVEALFTREEEAGMTGAIGLRPELLRGTLLMNLDSEDEGELFIGCAGGLNATVAIPARNLQAPPGDFRGVRIAVTGLQGGHSGMDIDLGRGNANKIMNRLLLAGSTGYGLLLGPIRGGSLRNAIPREAVAFAALPEAGTGDFLRELRKLGDEIGKELAATEPALRITAEPAAVPEQLYDKETTARLLNAVQACPNGVVRMSDLMEGLVETSNNLAMVESSAESIVMECLLRSSVASAQEDLARTIGSIAELAGATARFHGGYPGWQPNPGSPLLKLVRQRYTELFGSAPKVRAVHAGLECGIIGATCPWLDMISFGPTIRHPHSPDEKVDIASVGRFWQLLTDLLAAIPAVGN